MTAIRFDHIAIAAARIADAPAVLVGALGGRPMSGQPAAVFRWAAWTFAGGGILEILEPRGPDGFLHRFLDQRGPGVHHVTFKVPSLAAACARARAEGYDVVGLDESDPAWKETFLHPKQALGIVVQIVEARGDAEPSRWPPPPGPPDPPPPVTILGLRLRAHSRARARRQWERVLGGAATEGPRGELVYRWTGSPMRLVVEIDPEAAEGPVAVEYASDRAVALSEAPHPALGTAFLRAQA